MAAEAPSRREQVIVMAKPDGHARLYSADEVARLHGCWRDTLAWLRGADPDDLEYASVVAAVAQKAALRMPRYNSYDITTWITRASDVPVLAVPEHAASVALIEAVGEILHGIGFTQTGKFTGWLNRITIELMYRQANAFTANRDLLVPNLLKGPVAIAYFEGARTPLAHTLKLVVRSALAATTSPLTNLIHLDLVTERERALITASLEPDLGSRS